jgi:hypothetical protein
LQAAVYAPAYSAQQAKIAVDIRAGKGDLFGAHIFPVSGARRCIYRGTHRNRGLEMRKGFFHQSQQIRRGNGHPIRPRERNNIKKTAYLHLPTPRPFHVAGANRVQKIIKSQSQVMSAPDLTAKRFPAG